jgi:hypothetical protein
MKTSPFTGPCEGLQLPALPIKPSPALPVHVRVVADRLLVMKKDRLARTRRKLQPREPRLAAGTQDNMPLPE